MNQAKNQSDIFIQLLKAQQKIESLKPKLKAAPWQIEVGAVKVITHDFLPNGTILVSRELGDALFTALSEQANDCTN
ncbi:hypothetical protein FKG94_03275 [Exilibacterium tricleocarpae]|uniref:Uncharacterized protein n=1 Tax=Exilibacterium tricleocarpae TaxID=2591008 RepID=A0A545U6X8_9GAMM|nr:hypothetical protein [Exilibacterium tricleocarpae]TQV85225.1 hypothetical protein FKG94_03275 [Exilibacterium tricleocarpae]